MRTITTTPVQESKMQEWFCDDCQMRGTIFYGNGSDGVWSVAQELEAHHHRVSPKCFGNVRVLNYAADVGELRSQRDAVENYGDAGARDIRAPERLG